MDDDKVPAHDAFGNPQYLTECELCHRVFRTYRESAGALLLKMHMDDHKRGIIANPENPDELRLTVSDKKWLDSIKVGVK